MGVGGQLHALTALALERVLVPIMQEGRWALRAGLDGCGKSCPQRGLTMNRPIRIMSLLTALFLLPVM
jgi:hypothetical protein